MNVSRLNIKPLSVNDAWKGKRFKTESYKKYERDMLLMLKPMDIPTEGMLGVDIEFRFSSSGSDIDNPCKPLLDILQKKYGFNDSRIYSLLIKKKVVKKGEEAITFCIWEIEK